MKTWEMIKALTENPKKKYKRIDDDLIVKRNPITGEFKWRSGHAFLNVNDEWGEVKQPVTWQEALEAWATGKSITLKMNGQTEIIDYSGLALNKKDIQNGEWYINE